MKTILFFGDSNTWGYHPATGRRYRGDSRFTGILSSMLPAYRVIEEGLKGRTNATDDSPVAYRNGLKALPMLLCTHDPIDILVIMLGTNDVKRRFQLSAAEIGEGLEALISTTLTPHLWGGAKVPQILIVCPPGVTMDLAGSAMEGYFDQSSVEKSRLLHPVFKNVAKQYHCHYLNSMEVTGPGTRDGVHLEKEGHKRLADALYQKLKEIIL